MRAPIVALLAGIPPASPVLVGFPQTLAQGSALQPRQLEGTDTQRVLVIPVNLRGRAPVVVDRKQITQALYGAEDSVASRYRAVSYGKVEFAGSESDVVDPVTLSEPANFCDKGLGVLASAAEDEIRRRGIPLGPYKHFVFVIPKDAPCWWTGLGDIGGKRVWVKATTAKALAHELGHNLGMDHAVHWGSSDADASDFMGSGGASLNAPHVVQMGWLQSYPGKVVELTGGADVTLEALEADPRQSALPKVAIVRPTPGANTYYLSYRASSSANPLPDAFTGGLNIHAVGQARQTGGLVYFVKALSDGAAYGDGSDGRAAAVAQRGRARELPHQLHRHKPSSACRTAARAASSRAVPRLREMSRPSWRAGGRWHAGHSIRLPRWPEPAMEPRIRG